MYITRTLEHPHSLPPGHPLQYLPQPLLFSPVGVTMADLPLPPSPIAANPLARPPSTGVTVSPATPSGKSAMDGGRRWPRPSLPSLVVEALPYLSRQAHFTVARPFSWHDEVPTNPFNQICHGQGRRWPWPSLPALWYPSQWPRLSGGIPSSTTTAPTATPLVQICC